MKKKVYAGSLAIGGNADISIQSMCSCDTRDVNKTIKQIESIQLAGGELVRLAVPDKEAARALKKIIPASRIPLCADIHYDSSLAEEAIKAGIAKIRINPGNIGSYEKVKKLATLALEKNVPIRIGVNSGSIEKSYLNKYGFTAQALAESALKHVLILEKSGFTSIVISVKSSRVPMMIKAYKYLNDKIDYPLHLGVTEAGGPYESAVRSSVGIGHLLINGIGDTIRYSVTGDPVKEIILAKELLRCLELRKDLGPVFIACPTCGRTEIDLISLFDDVKSLCSDIKQPLTIAVMGCIVNGIGEGKHADIGIAGGKNNSVIFLKGKILKTVKNSILYKEFKQALDNLIFEKLINNKQTDNE
jgi:(E)-4-hydroxy-3-methylbut-2-enyl-diphosphate synthase